MIRLIDRYIWREMMPTMAEAAMLCTFVFFLRELFERTRHLVESWATFLQGITLFASALPLIGLTSIPVACLLATLLVYGRLSEENEITAMMAGGISLFQIIRPALLLGAILTGVLLYWSHVVTPLSMQYATSVAAKILEKSISGGMQAGHFQDIGNQHVLVAGEIDREAMAMRNVQLFEMQENGNSIYSMVISPSAQFRMNAEKQTLQLTMEGGVWHIIESSVGGPTPNENAEHEYQDITMRFSQMQFTLDMGSALSDKLNKSSSSVAYMLPRQLEASLQEKREKLVEYNAILDGIRKQRKDGQLKKHEEKSQKKLRQTIVDFEIERAQRVALPFSVLVMAAVAAPLGILTRRGRKGTCVALTILVVLGYYFVLSMGKALTESGYVPASIALWLPNILSLVAAGFSYRKAEKI